MGDAKIFSIPCETNILPPVIRIEVTDSGLFISYCFLFYSKIVMNPKLNQAQNTVLILGPSLDAVSGVSTHLQQLFCSELLSRFELQHYQVGSEGRKESSIARIIRLLLGPLQFARSLISTKAILVHFNTSFDRNAFWRDVGYVLVAKLLCRKILYQVHGGPMVFEFSASGRLTQSVVRKMFLYSNVVVVLSKTHRPPHNG